ncbi:MAG: HlyD family secretion protein [Gemmatimonadota bacterium]|jgi:membrane fusion protein (multidrug efflux system)
MAEPVKEPTAPRSRRRVLLIFGVLVVLTALVWGVRRWQYGRVHESTDDAYVTGRLVPVLAKVGGYASTVRAEDNQHVAAGETLVTIDERELSQRLAQAEAELAAAEAAAGVAGTPGQVQAQVEQARRQRAALDAQIEAAQANVDRAERDLSRLEGLADKQIISQQQLDAARAAVDAGRAGLRALQEQRSAADAAVATAQAGLRQAQARLEAARVAVDAARLQLSYARVTAPVAGLVAKRSAEPGQLLQPGQPLLTIVADSGIYITANFKETQVSDIRPGADVEFDVDAYDGCEGGGTVESLGGATGSQFALLPAENATGNFTKVVQRVPVRIAVTRGCGPERPLRPGMSVIVHVATG